MGQIKWENKYSFGEHGHVWILWDVGEEEYGYEIEIMGEDGPLGELGTLGQWSFGYESWSRDLWSQWGEYVSECILNCQDDFKELEAVLEQLNTIDCMAYKNHPDYDGSETNLKDLEKVQKILAKKEADFEEALNYIYSKNRVSA